MDSCNNPNILYTSFSNDEQSIIVSRNTVLSDATKNLFVTYMQQTEQEFTSDGSSAEISRFKDKILEAIEDFTLDTNYIILDTLYRTSVKFNKKAVSQFPFGVTDPYNFQITISSNSLCQSQDIITISKLQPIVIEQWNVRDIASFTYTDYSTKESKTIDVATKINFDAGITKRTFPHLALKDSSITIANSYNNKALIDIQYNAGYVNNILTTLPEDILRCIAFSAWQRYRMLMNDCADRYNLEIIDIKNKYITTLPKKISNSFVYITNNGAS